MTYMCMRCGREYAALTSNNTCDDCGELLLTKGVTMVKEDTVHDPSIVGENGIGIIVMDFSYSMQDRAFPAEMDYNITKANAVISALQSAIPQLREVTSAENAYLVMIGFAEEAKVLDVFRLSEVNPDRAFWASWLAEKMQDVNRTCGGGTNFTAALKLAKEVYDGALKGNLKKFGIQNFAPMYQNIPDPNKNETYTVANVRVFIYSDGLHESASRFVNAFDDASLIPGQSNVNGVTTVFLGDTSNDGYKLMERIAGVCPCHNIRAVINIDKPEYYDNLRKLFHMASSASGLCLQCSKASEGKHDFRKAT
jgi:DNA-directed RNA polymerase subunit RPC12/RpoP